MYTGSNRRLRAVVQKTMLISWLSWHQLLHLGHQLCPADISKLHTPTHLLHL